MHPRSDEAQERVAAVDATERFFRGLGLSAAKVDWQRVGQILDTFFALGENHRGDVEARERARAIRTRVDAALAAKGPLVDLVERVKADLLRHHAPLTEFLSRADLGTLLAHPRLPIVAADIAHHAFVLDALVTLMAEDERFAREIRRHLYAEQAAAGITLRWMQQRAGFFAALKVATIDVAFKPILGGDGFLERTRARSRLSAFDFASWACSVPLNIAEAVFTELLAGSRDNAAAGRHLAMSLPRSGRLGIPHKEVMIDYPPQWVALYESWNLLFVFSHLDDPHLLVAKLLFPKLTAGGETFMFYRLLALWLTIHSYAFLQRNGHHLPGLDLPPSYTGELRTLWGRINRSYGERLAWSRRSPGR